MKTRCLIACTNEVIMIGKQSDMECIGMYSDKEVDLRSLVDRAQPHVLVIDQYLKDHSYFPGLFLNNHASELLVIVLENDQNRIQIFQKGERFLSSNSDLISEIRYRGGVHG